MADLTALKWEGILVGAYSPPGPGAILIFQTTRENVESALTALPLVTAE
jgi:hypothetical protein